MYIPAGMNILTAQAMLRDLPGNVLDDQKKELLSEVPKASKDFVEGYQLGLQTARAFLAGNATLILKGIDPKEVL